MTTLTVEQSLFAATITDLALEQMLCDVVDSSSLGCVPNCLISSSVAARLIENVTVNSYGLLEVIDDAVHDYLRRTDKFVSVRGREGGVYRREVWEAEVAFRKFKHEWELHKYGPGVRSC